MTGKQLFESMGYEVMELMGYVDVRKKKGNRYGREIEFWKEEKKVKLRGWLTVAEIIAMYQMIKDMGWIR